MKKKRLDRLFRADERHGMRPLALVSGPRGCYSYPEDSGDDTFLLAEAGRMFTAVLAARLKENGVFDFDTRARDVLNKEEVPQEKTIGQLLLEDATGHPDDILVDNVLAKAGGMPVSELLHREIIDPLCMSSTYVLFASEPGRAAALKYQTPCVAGEDAGQDERLQDGLISDRIVSSPSDLMIFQRALYMGTLISPDTLTRMQKMRSEKRHGVRRGMGFMELSLDSPRLVPRALPTLMGYSGSLATHVYFDVSFNTHYVLSYADTAHVRHAKKRLAQMVDAS